MLFFLSIPIHQGRPRRVGPARRGSGRRSVGFTDGVSQTTWSGWTEGFVIRGYTPDDEPACLAILASNVPAYFMSEDVDEFRQFLCSGCGDYFVTDVDGAVR